MFNLIRTRPCALYLILVTIGVAAGLFLGSRVLAGGTEPGSAADPLVARSYVDEQVAAYIAGLEKRVADLTAREAQLESALAEVQKQQGLTPIQPVQPSPAAPVSTSGQTGTSGQAPASGQPVSQQLYIKMENSYVNLRQGPGTGYPLVGTAVRGKTGSEPMTVLATNGAWYQVRLPDGRTGWVANWLVEVRP